MSEKGSEQNSEDFKREKTLTNEVRIRLANHILSDRSNSRLSLLASLRNRIEDVERDLSIEGIFSETVDFNHSQILGVTLEPR